MAFKEKNQVAWPIDGQPANGSNIPNDPDRDNSQVGAMGDDLWENTKDNKQRLDDASIYRALAAMKADAGDFNSTATATSSHTAGGSNAQNAVDENSGTAWITDRTTNALLEVDFASNRTIGGIGIVVPDSGGDILAKSIKIEVSTDNVSFTTAISSYTLKNQSTKQYVPLPPDKHYSTAFGVDLNGWRYWKITFLDSYHATDDIQVEDIWFYGTAINNTRVTSGSTLVATPEGADFRKLEHDYSLDGINGGGSAGDIYHITAAQWADLLVTTQAAQNSRLDALEGASGAYTEVLADLDILGLTGVNDLNGVSWFEITNASLGVPDSKILYGVLYVACASTVLHNIYVYLRGLDIATATDSDPIITEDALLANSGRSGGSDVYSPRVVSPVLFWPRSGRGDADTGIRLRLQADNTTVNAEAGGYAHLILRGYID